MSSRFFLRGGFWAALVGLALVLFGPAQPASAMCGGNIFMKCPKPARAAVAHPARPRASKPRQKPVISR